MLRQWLLTAVCIMGLSSTGFAITFKDMPANHWAADSVQKIVEMGVTSGYPDGTFRGTRTVNRYDLAIFMAKMAEYLEKKIESVKTSSTETRPADAATDPNIAALKAEVQGLQQELVLVKKQLDTQDIHMSQK